MKNEGTTNPKERQINLKCHFVTVLL